MHEKDAHDRYIVIAQTQNASEEGATWERMRKHVCSSFESRYASACTSAKRAWHDMSSTRLLLLLTLIAKETSKKQSGNSLPDTISQVLSSALCYQAWGQQCVLKSARISPLSATFAMQHSCLDLMLAICTWLDAHQCSALYPLMARVFSSNSICLRKHIPRAGTSFQPG